MKIKESEINLPRSLKKNRRKRQTQDVRQKAFYKTNQTKNEKQKARKQKIKQKRKKKNKTKDEQRQQRNKHR